MHAQAQAAQSALSTSIPALDQTYVAHATAITLYTCLDGSIQVACPTQPPAAVSSGSGVIIGIAVGVGLLAVAAGVWFWRQRRLTKDIGAAAGTGAAYVQDIELDDGVVVVAHERAFKHIDRYLICAFAGGDCQ